MSSIPQTNTKIKVVGCKINNIENFGGFNEDGKYSSFDNNYNNHNYL